MTNPKCIGYIRFSSTSQSEGMSEDRQLENIKNYALKHYGQEISDADIYIDRALSAFTGKNRKFGKLKEMLDQIEDGSIPKGTILLTESFDRITREGVFTVFAISNTIFQHDMTIVSLSDGKKYSKDYNLGDLFQLVAIAATANEESVKKRFRTSNNWQQMREKAGSKKMTSRSPAWLSLNDERTEFIPDKDRVELIKKIYQLSYSGVGINSIAKRLNHEKIESWNIRVKEPRKTEGWQQSYIGKILTNRAVLGEFQPHIMSPETGKRIPFGNVIPDYYPPIIDEKLFYAVQAQMKSKTHSGGRTGKLSNLFGGVAECGYCGGTMQIVNKGNNWVYLICDNAWRGLKCLNVYTPYKEIEQPFLNFCINELKYVVDKDRNFKAKQIRELEEDKSANIGRHKELTKNIELISSELKSAQDNTKFQILLGLQAEQSKSKLNIENDIARIEAQLYSLINDNNDSDKAVSEFLNTIYTLNTSTDEQERILFRTKLRHHIRTIIRKIVIYPVGIMMSDDLTNIRAKRDESKMIATKYSKDKRYFVIFFENGDNRYIVHNERIGGYYVKSERTGNKNKIVSLQNALFNGKTPYNTKDEVMLLDDELEYYMMVSNTNMTKDEMDSSRRFLSGAYVYNKDGDEVLQ